VRRVTMIDRAITFRWVVLMTLAAAASASAQQPVQETVVVTGAAVPLSLGNSGRSVTLITREQIDSLPVTGVADLLRSIGSADIRARGPFDAQADLSIRGASFGGALVLVDGVRLNDLQSGHHNSDIPLPLGAIERVEVLLGAGSSLYGADALGGTINVIPRKDATPHLNVAGGSFDLVDVAGGAGKRTGDVLHAVTGSLSRSSGFMPERDHDIRAIRYSVALSRAWSVDVSHVDKEFGANGFYGPAPSREWTDQTLVGVSHRLLQSDAWQSSARVTYRSHGDRFLYDVTRPALSDNRHRTHAAVAQFAVNRRVSSRAEVSAGAEGGGDWIASSNLGDHTIGRGSAFVEWRQQVGSRLFVHPGVRYDRYSRFGDNWSPSLAVSGWIVPSVKWRTSAGRAFRIPTFTERYYRDPNHQAVAELRPERAWLTDAGVDWFPKGQWTVSATVFGRWEEDVIDWVRATPAERWQTTNVHDVRTRGAELSIRRAAASHGEWGLQYTRLASRADRLELLSKYVADFARDSLAGWLVARAGRWSLGPRVEFKRRADGRDYWVLDARVAHRFGPWEVYVDGANLLDTGYQEVIGVAMPGRWMRVGVKR